MFTRDSWIWLFGIVASVIVGLATVSDPAQYGIPEAWVPYLRLGALVCGIISAKASTSWAPEKKS